MIDGVESARAPQEIADVHEEAVEFVDVGARVFWVAAWREAGHGGFEGDFVGCEEGGQGREHAEDGGKEGEEVDRTWLGGEDADGVVRWSVRDGMR